VIFSQCFGDKKWLNSEEREGAKLSCPCRSLCRCCRLAIRKMWRGCWATRAEFGLSFRSRSQKEPWQKDQGLEEWQDYIVLYSDWSSCGWIGLATRSAAEDAEMFNYGRQRLKGALEWLSSVEKHPEKCW